METLTLTTPQIVTTTTSAYTIDLISLDIRNLSISIQIRGQNSEVITKTYDNSTVPTGALLLHTLNTSNFSVNSLLKAILNRLITDGVLLGSVTGTTA